MELPSQPIERRSMGLAYELDGTLAVLTLDNAPENRIDEVTLEDAEQALLRLRSGVADNTVRAVLLRGAGEVFSAGADAAQLVREGAGVGVVTARFMRVVHGIEALPVPTVAAVHGMCLAGGFELALSADLLIAQEGTLFGLPESRLGIMPLGGGVQRLAERAGPGRALQMVYLTEVKPAETLYDWGVVSQVLQKDGFLEASRSIAEKLAVGPTQAHAATKALVRGWRTGGIPVADALLAEVTEPLFGTEDARLGFTAYANVPGGQRVPAPNFVGR
ncbi:enoyl-CoA hydratase/isomerase family protein [Streptomyces variegatus]|uniref:enoyl-CoA hydratase/isomerase family protein n=1 Tax=Streptomyces variegatus TaxID=284040 RepID=UPI003C2BBF3E